MKRKSSSLKQESWWDEEREREGEKKEAPEHRSVIRVFAPCWAVGEEESNIWKRPNWVRTLLLIQPRKNVFTLTLYINTAVGRWLTHFSWSRQVGGTQRGFQTVIHLLIYSVRNLPVATQDRPCNWQKAEAPLKGSQRHKLLRGGEQSEQRLVRTNVSQTRQKVFMHMNSPVTRVLINHE